MREYLNAFRRELRQDTEAVFSLKFMILYHWESGAPLEFHERAAYDRHAFESQPGWRVLDGLGGVTRRPRPPQRRWRSRGPLLSCPIYQYNI